MEWVVTHAWPVVLYLPIYTIPRMAWWFAVLAKSGDTVGYSEAWMNMIPVHGLCPRLVRPYSCTYKTCEMVWQHIHGLWFFMSQHIPP